VGTRASTTAGPLTADDGIRADTRIRVASWKSATCTYFRMLEEDSNLRQ
jgi:hypothetical protein